MFDCVYNLKILRRKSEKILEELQEKSGIGNEGEKREERVLVKFGEYFFGGGGCSAFSGP